MRSERSSELARIMLLAITLGFAQNAQAQLNHSQTKCIERINAAGTAVSTGHARSYEKCIGDFLKGKVDDVHECVYVTRFSEGKLKKTQRNWARHCDRSDAERDVGPQDPNAVNAASLAKEDTLFARMFGSDPASGFFVLTGDRETDKSVKASSACQSKVWSSVRRCQDRAMDAFVDCGVDAAKGKNGPAVVTNEEFQDRCMGTGSALQPDPRGRIARDCTNLEKGKLIREIIRSCEDKGIALTDAFGHGDCVLAAAGGSVDLMQCMAARAACSVCTWTNATQGFSRDCDLADNGSADSSCP